MISPPGIIVAKSARIVCHPAHLPNHPPWHDFGSCPRRDRSLVQQITCAAMVSRSARVSKAQALSLLLAIASRQSHGILDTPFHLMESSSRPFGFISSSSSSPIVSGNLPGAKPRARCRRQPDNTVWHLAYCARPPGCLIITGRERRRGANPRTSRGRVWTLLACGRSCYRGSCRRAGVRQWCRGARRTCHYHSQPRQSREISFVPDRRGAACVFRRQVSSAGVPSGLGCDA